MKSLFFFMITMFVLLSCGEVENELYVDEALQTNSDDTLTTEDLVEIVDKSISEHKKEKALIDSLSRAIEDEHRVNQHYINQVYEYNQQEHQVLEEIIPIDSFKFVTKDSFVYNIQYVDSVIEREVIVYDTIHRGLILDEKKKKKKKRNGNN